MQPSRTKYRKQFRGKNRGVATRGADLAFGEFGLQALTHGQFSARQIEASRKVIAHATKRLGKIWIRVFPDHPITKKPLGVKMGSGKGDIQEYVAKIKPQRVLFEIGGVSEATAREALRKAGHKIPMRTKFIKRQISAAQRAAIAAMKPTLAEEEPVTPVTEVIAEETQTTEAEQA